MLDVSTLAAIMEASEFRKIQFDFWNFNWFHYFFMKSVVKLLNTLYRQYRIKGYINIFMVERYSGILFLTATDTEILKYSLNIKSQDFVS